MKRIFKILSICLFLVGSCLTLSACFGNENNNSNYGKEKLTEEMVNIYGNVCYYDYGNPVMIPDENFKIWVPGHGYADIADFTVEYENNVNVDDDSYVIITANADNEYAYGSVRIQFDIYPIDRELNNKAEFDEIYHTSNTRRLLIKCDITVDEGETLSFDRTDCYVLFENDNTNLTLTNNGTINIADAFILDRSAQILNNGTININHGGEMRFYQSAKMLDKGTVNNEGTVNCYGTIYTHDNDIAGVHTGTYDGHMYVRHRLTSDSFWLSYDTTEYKDGTTEYKPTVTIAGSIYDRAVSYSNNTSAGTATVTVSVSEYHPYFYGDAASRSFSITKGEATFETFEELVAKQATGNFDRYKNSSLMSSYFTMPTNSTFTLNSDETLSIVNSVSSLSINGTFINNGTVVINPSYGFNLYVYGTLINNNIFTMQPGKYSLDSYNRNLYIYGTFKNGDENNYNATIVCDNISNHSSQTYNSETFKNYGTFTARKTGQFCYDFANYGTITFNNNVTFEESVLNQGIMYFSENFTTTFKKVDISNGGTINNDGDIVCYDNFVKFENDGTFTNDGHIWTYETLENVSGSITLKKRLSDLNVVLAYDQVDYDGLSKTPTFTIIDGEEQIVATGVGYGMSYTYTVWNSHREENDTNKATPKYPGVITATLTIGEGKYNYGGSHSASFTINRVVYETSNQYLLADKLRDKDYSGYKLTSDISLTSASNTTYNIGEDQTFDSNGNCLTIGNKITLINNGTITLSSTLNPEDLSDCALVISGTGVFGNNGIITNDGVIYVETPSNTFTSTNSITNNGKMYVFENVTTQGTGNLYKRKFLENLKNNETLTLEYETILYDATNKMPSPVLFVGSTASFTTTYENNLYPSTEGNPAVATISVPLFDSAYAGSTSIDFTIERGIKMLTETEYNVYTEGSGTNIFDDENYAIYRLGTNTKITRWAVAELPENTTLDLGDYTIDFNGFYNHLTIPTTSHIHINVDSAERWVYADGFADQITLTNDIGDSSSTQNYYYNEEWTRKEHRAYLQWASIFTSVFVDLNGHTIEGQLSLRTTYPNKTFTITINDSSADKTGQIGSTGGSTYGLLLDSNGDRKMNVVLNDIKVMGCKIIYTGTPDNTNLIANDCTFTSTNQYGIFCGANMTLTNCSVTGPTGIFTNSKGEITLSGCMVRGTASFVATTGSSHLGQGCAILYYAYNNHTRLTINQSSRLQSTNGHGIEYVYWKQQSGGSNHTHITLTSVTYSLPSGRQQILDTPITG